MRPGSRLLMAGLALALAACAKEPEPPRTLTLTVTGGAGINPNAEGTATPVVLRLYELRQASGFEAAGFFDLQDGAQATLGPDLVRSERIALRPGQTVETTWTLDEASRTVGAVAAFRDLDRADWRASAPLTAEKAQALSVTVSGKSVAVGGE